MWVNTLQHHPWPILQWGILLAAAAAGAVLDARSRRIPNLLTGPLFVGGLVVSTWAGGFPGLFDSLAAAVVLALPFVLLFVVAGGGAGDAKLMGALGAWLGLVNGVLVLAAVLICGGVLGVGYALARRRLGQSMSAVTHVARAYTAASFGGLSLRDANASLPTAAYSLPMPYGPSILLGLLISGAWLLWSK